ncbi:MAG: hypothetical protein ABFC97_01760 [Anaerolineaceae bacterium]|nr:hypothetical protein [Anaerolineaceae bacterium]
MNDQVKSLQVMPPRLFPTLLKGFNTVANRVTLLLIPVLVDLFLWLGPKLRVNDLLSSYLQNFSTTMLRYTPEELLESMRAATTTYTGFLEQFNLFSLVRTIPIGIPSLLARMSSLESPLGKSILMEVPSFGIAAVIMIGLLLIGFFLGAVYFNSLARYSLDEPEKLNWKKLIAQVWQTILFFLILVVLLILIAIPISILLSLVSLFSAALAQFLIFGLFFILIWLVLPLVFSPHGIFAIDQKAFPSMLISMRMIRFFLPGTSLFVLTSVLISEGLNMLWTIPEPGSWLLALGIGGHAFTVTGLLCASFFYYREGLKWMQYNIQRLQELKQQQETGGSSVE